MSNIGIQSLMSAADAAGYVMAAEDELPDAFGRKPSIFDFKALPATAVAIWRPIAPRISGSSQGQATQSLSWFGGRRSTGATA